MSNHPTDKQIQDAYALAQERYAMLGVDTDQALETLAQISISLHCWQGDDVAGFESPDTELGGGIAATGNYPGKARNADELRSDLDKAYSLIPGNHRLNLHSIYAETGGKRVERNELQHEIEMAIETGRLNMADELLFELGVDFLDPTRVLLDRLRPLIGQRTEHHIRRHRFLLPVLYTVSSFRPPIPHPSVSPS